MKASMEDTEYFNPRSSCEERRVNAGDNVVWNGISIHAPHARSDMAYVALTLSAAYFNPRSSCEERLAHLLAGEGRPPISIHAPHARSDVGKIYWRHQKEISIHAPHARSDATTFCMDAVVSNFNPRSSCEERPDVLLFTNHRDIFQSTLLMRGATAEIPMRGRRSTDFNPRSSCEERQDDLEVYAEAHDFNPRSSCEERPRLATANTARTSKFQSTLLMRGATPGQRRRGLAG